MKMLFEAFKLLSIYLWDLYLEFLRIFDFFWDFIEDQRYKKIINLIDKSLKASKDIFIDFT